jgi:hypothetical protein
MFRYSADISVRPSSTWLQPFSHHRGAPLTAAAWFIKYHEWKVNARKAAAMPIQLDGGIPALAVISASNHRWKAR